MVRIAHGLVWRTDSPSRWELVGYPLRLEFRGDRWVACAHGADHEVTFTTLSEGMTYVSLALSRGCNGAA